MERSPSRRSSRGPRPRRTSLVVSLVFSLATPLLVLGAGPARADASPPFVTEWGQNAGGVGDLSNPRHVAIGPGGRLYEADSGREQVQEFTLAGVRVGAWGTEGTGPGQFTSGPRGLTTDAAGRVYATDDVGPGRVQVFDADGGFVSQFTDAALVDPRGIAVGSSGEIYVADRGSSSSNDGTIRRYAADGTFLGTHGTIALAIDPCSLAFGPTGELFVSDCPFLSGDRVVVLGADGSLVRQWGSDGTTDGKFSTTQGLVVAPAGDVYVGDATGRIQQFGADGTFVRSRLVSGFVSGWSNDVTGLAVDPATGQVVAAVDGEVSSLAHDRIEVATASGAFVTAWGEHAGDGRLFRPEGVAVAPSGHVYVADTLNQQVQQFTAAGTFVRRWGGNGPGEGQFKFPYGIGVGSAGDVYVADTYNDRVQQFTAAGAFVRSWGGPGTADGRFNEPEALAVGPSGDVYVADTDNKRIQQFTADGTFVRKWSLSGTCDGSLGVPKDIAISASGDVLVADSVCDRVQRFTAAGAFVATMATDADRPTGLAVDAAGRITVVDRSSHVRQYAPDGALLTAWGPVEGSAPGEFDTPGGVAISPSGTLFVADTENDRMQSFGSRPAALSVTVSADETDVLPGDTIHYEVRIANTGDTALTGITISDPVAPDCAGPVPGLAVAAVFTVECERATTGADPARVVNVVTVDSDQTDPTVSNEVEVSVSRFTAPQYVRTWWASPTALPDGDPTLSSAIAVDPDGHVRVAGDRTYRPVRAVSRFSPDGAFVDRVLDPTGPTTGVVPTAVAVADSGVTYVGQAGAGEASEVRRFTASGAFDGEINLASIDIDVAPDGTLYGLSGTGRVFEAAGSSSVYFAGNPGETSGLHDDPEGLAVGPDGRVYVADTDNFRVSVFRPDGTFDRVWGTEGIGNGQFTNPSGIAVDEAGRVYVDDETRMQVFSADGDFLGKFPLTSSRFDVRTAPDGSVHVYLGSPDGAVVEVAFPTGPMLRVDLGTAVTQADVGQPIGYTAQVTNIGTVALTGVTVVASALPGCAGPIGGLAPGASQSVSCSTVPVSGDVGRFRRTVAVDTDQTPLVLSNPTTVEVLRGTRASWGAAGTGPGRFSAGAGIALAAGDVFVADCGNDRVQRFTADGAFVAAWGTSGSGPGQFDCPIDLARTGSSLMVLDQGNHRVQRFGLDGSFEAAWPYGGNADATPTGIDTDADGHVYVVDSQLGHQNCYVVSGIPVCEPYVYPSGGNVVRQYSSAGMPLGVSAGGSDDTGALFLPRGLYVSSDGFVEVAVPGRARVWVGSTSASGRVASLDLAGVDVWDVAEDAQRNVYVADQSHSLVRKYSPGGVELARWSVAAPRSLAVADDGRLFVMSGNRVVLLEGAASGSSLWGTVTDSGSGAPVAGAQVAVLRASDLSFEQGATADAGGVFSAQVPPGSYRVYVLDPTGDHTNGFAGGTAPGLYTVSAGAAVEADASMASTRGTVTGTITEQGTGTPIAQGYTVVIDAGTGRPLRGAAANGSGQVSVGDLEPGSSWVLHLDRTGAHAPAYHPGSPVPAGATPVAVTAGGAAVSNGSLVAQAVDPGGAALTGRVFAKPLQLTVSLEGALVVALRASDYRFVRGTTTDASGNYSLDVSPGEYRLAFFDPSGTSDLEWFEDQPYDGLASASTVTAPSSGVNATLVRSRGVVSGSVRSAGSGSAIGGAWVVAFDLGGQLVAGTTSKSSSGGYDLTGLPAGTYRIVFVDPTGAHQIRFYRDAASPFDAEEIEVTGNSVINPVRGELPG